MKTKIVFFIGFFVTFSVSVFSFSGQTNKNSVCVPFFNCVQWTGCINVDDYAGLLLGAMDDSICVNAMNTYKSVGSSGLIKKRFSLIGTTIPYYIAVAGCEESTSSDMAEKSCCAAPGSCPPLCCKNIKPCSTGPVKLW